ncbi:16S rRNA (uracil(1498)-N(3))-methyltransferase [Aestuariibius insulae]|uniref:16S rRNA (uracil(1498)-N(3))-methyltransferase n=1 Tax=Aestuariibius insulae TaxID=2058287 RepID=UPI00345E23C2
MVSVVRLYVDHPLAEGHLVPLERDQAHYLVNVMRLSAGATVAVFNGADGEWSAELTDISKRAASLRVMAQTRPLRPPPDLWLLFAPIKKARTDFIVEKATELGAARILPVQTDHTNSERIRQDRLQTHAIEAAEQCGGTYVPEVEGLQKLSALLDRWPEERQLLFCDEALAEDDGSSGFAKTPGPCAILIGPEGGFSAAERTRLARLGTAIRLGPRILRADTAAVAALTLWQAAAGDWS